jgi:protein-S-isoprenylcysteine O-methyltransferase Ste14
MPVPGTDPRSLLIVGAQSLALAALAWPGSARWRLHPVVAVAAGAAAVAGAGVAIAAGTRLGADLTPLVEPRPGARLHTDGLYRFSRNPLYAGVLPSSAGVAVLRRRPEPLVAVAALSVIFHVKVGVEESRLRARFGSEYEAYAARTGRLLPRVRRDTSRGSS